MTTMTYTATAQPIKTVDFGAFILPIAKKVAHFLKVCAGVYAEQDSNYRGLDLNGNAVWATSPNF
ncbi:hypothetical protein [Algirhabdus cladophorae]|uniref:hypothetical protein n=1 Tax=Algirhabdus cladophorae TaxID=3377108 RepID=UPI003B847464